MLQYNLVLIVAYFLIQLSCKHFRLKATTLSLSKRTINQIHKTFLLLLLLPYLILILSTYLTTLNGSRDKFWDKL